MKRALLLSAALLLVSSVAFAVPWLQQYPLESYSQIWHVRLKVKSLDRALPDVIKTLQKNGGVSTIPLGNTVASKLHGYQQLSFQFSRRSAERAVRRLKKFGTLDNSPAIGTGADDPQIGADIDDKLRRLKSEGEANREALERMPAVSALVSEMAEHLKAVKNSRENAKDRVLVNFEISEEAAPGH